MVMDDAIYQLLYSDENGEVVGVGEVQLLESEEERDCRTPKLLALLTADDPYAGYQALLILLAWAEPGAVGAALELLTDPSKIRWSDPHRMGTADESFDKIAHAISVGISCNGLESEVVEPHAVKLLELAPTVLVQHGLQSLLIAIGNSAFAPSIEAMVRNLVEVGQEQQAGDLLPALGVLAPETAWAVMVEFEENETLFDATVYGVTSTLRKIGSARARSELERLASANDERVAKAAELTLRNWG